MPPIGVCAKRRSAIRVGTFLAQPTDCRRVSLAVLAGAAFVQLLTALTTSGPSCSLVPAAPRSLC
jgi:hypothetical protein